jgi:hypothetical protein
VLDSVKAARTEVMHGWALKIKDADTNLKGAA